MELIVKFKFERETKNFVRFKEIVERPTTPPIIGTLYITKLVFQGDYLKYAGCPDLEVTVRSI